jgi:hypothetical protein
MSDLREARRMIGIADDVENRIVEAEGKEGDKPVT